MSTKPRANDDSPKGLAFAIAAYFLWGFLPIYMKALAHVSPAEVIAHRVLWSVPVAGAILVWLGRTNDLRAAIRNPRMIGMAAMTAALISINWGIYVWAIGAGHALDTALGYYINPLFSILVGALALGEKLSRMQMAAIALAFLAVVILTVENGSVPWVALGLTLSWGFYALLKKQLPIGPNQGFFLEVLIMVPFALGLVGWHVWQGDGHFMMGNAWDNWLLAGTGIVTAVPLMLYANGAKMLRLSTIGILQYIAPTMIFLTAVFVFGEPFGKAQMIAFPMIWAALLVYTWSLLRRTPA